MTLGFGTWHLRERGLLKLAYDLGIRHFDTAPIYPDGIFESAELAIKEELPHEDAIIYTKAGRHWERPPLWKRPRLSVDGLYSNFSPRRLLRQLAGSTARLGRQPNAVYLHCPNVKTLKSKKVRRWMREMLARGITYGASVHTAEEVKAAALAGFQIIQAPFVSLPGFTPHDLRMSKLVVREVGRVTGYGKEWRQSVIALWQQRRYIDLVLFETNNKKHLKENVERWNAILSGRI